MGHVCERQTLGRLALRAAGLHSRRRPHGYPCRFGQSAQRRGGRGVEPHGRLGRFGPVQQHVSKRGPFDRRFRGGRNIRFGVREHAMGGILNGLALHGGVLPYGGTFLVFSDYMRPSIRMAALSGAHVVYVFTHDSVAVGEDGPTHQPVEHLAALRAIPGLTVIRPTDANETAEAWRVALEEVEGPTALILTRQNVPILDRSHLAGADLLSRGAYVLSDPHGGTMEVIIMASGSEVHTALSARICCRCRASWRGGGLPQLGAVRGAVTGVPRRGAAAVSDRACRGGGRHRVGLGTLGG